MGRAIRAFGLNDLRSVRRDSLLIWVALGPFLYAGLVRLVVPPITDRINEAFGLDLLPYYPLLGSLVFVVTIPLLYGTISGFLILDERDYDTLTALRVSPIPIATYAGYRAVAALLVSAVTTTVALPLSGLGGSAGPLATALIALAAGCLSMPLALLLAAVASNKVEGFALMRGASLPLVFAPLAAYFVDERWQLLFGVLPSYWSARSYWAASAGEAFWPYLLVGAAYNALLAVPLLGRFRRRLR